MNRTLLRLTPKAYRILAILKLNEGWTPQQRAALRRWKP